MESAKVVWRDGKFASVCVCGGGGEKNIFLSGVFFVLSPDGAFLTGGCVVCDVQCM